MCFSLKVALLKLLFSRLCLILLKLTQYMITDPQHTYDSGMGYAFTGQWKSVQYRRMVSKRGCFHSRLMKDINNKSWFTYSWGGQTFETITEMRFYATKRVIALFCHGIGRIANMPDNKVVMQYDLRYKFSQN